MLDRVQFSFSNFSSPLSFKSTRLVSSSPPAAPDVGPRQHGAVLPTELMERIIDFLCNDKRALLACSLVCRNLFPTSRWHLYTLLPVVPVSLTSSGLGGRKINTAVALTNGTVLYGTNDGVYVSDPGSALRRVVKASSAVSQIDALESHNLLLILSGRRLLGGPLSIIRRHPSTQQQPFTLISSDVSFFKVGDHGGKRIICVVCSGRFTSHYELMEVLPVAPDGRQRPVAQPFRSFYLPERAHAVHIGNKTIAAALRSGFQCVDPLSLATFPVPVDNDGPHPRRGDMKCRAMFRVDQSRFLMCYDQCAFYMDRTGIPCEPELAIRWAETAKQFALVTPQLLLAFTRSGMHAWRVDTGERVQTVHGMGIRLLSVAPSVLIKLKDGTVVALKFTESR